MAFPALRSRSIRHSDQRQLLHAVVPYPIKETWTHDFCCLQFKNQRTTPSATQLEMLNKAGYGRTKIKFENKAASHQEVCEKLENSFPSLRAVGGYTLLRAKNGGLNRPLEVLNCKWYDISSLRKAVPTSACIYIRPLQENLQLIKKVRPLTTKQ